MQSGRSLTRRLETVFLPALICTVTVPLQACAAVTPAGSVSRPVVVNRYGARRSRPGVVRALSRAENRGTTTARTALAVCPALSTAMTTSVLRPTSSPCGV